MKHLSYESVGRGLVAVALILAPLAHAQERLPVLSLSAVAVGPNDPSGPAASQTGSVTIVIERWTGAASSTGEVSGVGFVRSGQRIVALLVSAHEEVDRGTKERRIRIETDKPVGQWDITSQSLLLNTAATLPPESTAFEIHLSAYGTGEGRVREASGTGTGPIRLAGVSTDRKDQLKSY